MGVKIELNWFVVVDGCKELKGEASGYYVVKDELRVYPIGGILPLIFKDEEKCVGMVRVTGCDLRESTTKIYFEMVQPFDKFYPAAQHYYSMYKAMKNSNTELIKY